MEELEWSPSTEHLEDILKNPKVQLPQIIRVSEDFVSDIDNIKVEKGQFLVLHGIKNIEYLVAKDKDDSEFNIPVGCPFKVKLALPPGKDKTFETILDLAKSEPLPKFVEVTKASQDSKVLKGDRLKVVIVEKSGGDPSVIHFRNSSGKHVKVAVSEDISFSLAANDASEIFISKLAEKSHELPLHARFVENSETGKKHIKSGILTFTKSKSEKIVVSTVKQKKKELALVFSLNDTQFKFDVNSNLKLANDENYRNLCTLASDADMEKVCMYFYKHTLQNISSRYVYNYKDILKDLGETLPEGKTLPESHTDSDESDLPSPVTAKKKSLPENTLTIDNEQKELVKKQQKEHQKQVKAEKERLKAEKKKEKKERKEREKEEKKKKKETLSRSNTEVSEPPDNLETLDEDLYITPHSPIPQTSQEEQYIDNGHYQPQQPQWALHLMKNVKKLRDRTKSVGLKSKKRGKLKKEDIKFSSSDNLDDDSLPTSPGSSTYYSAMEQDPFSESLYETLPCEMAYESLDLIAQAQRSFAPMMTESSGDSGFDEIDQAKIKAWRDAMAPPPLPGNHPVQKSHQGSCDDLYEVAVDGSNPDEGQMNTAWQTFYNIVEQSTKEISSWDMEDVANCLIDLKLGPHQQIFSDSQIDGQLLIDLDESVLRDLGLSPFEARKLRKFTFGWRPDIMRPPNYPKLEGFESEDPSQWSEEDVIKHLNVIEIIDFAEFCRENQVNGDLLKDICVDDAIMSSIITTKDKKLKAVKIKNYAVDKWRPKKKGEGNYISVSSLQKQMSNSHSPVLKKSNSNVAGQRLSTNLNGKESTSSPSSLKRSESSPYSARKNSPLSTKKRTGDAPLVARMRQQFEEKKN